MPFYSFEGKVPMVSPCSFVHPEATLIGDVEVKEGCYIGPGARLRGDWGRITVGPGCNIQENCVIHVKPDQEVIIGGSSHIAHGAILHGPTLGYHVVVGMGAIVMDNAVLEDECCIAAGALVNAGVKIPSGKLVVGAPGRIVGDVSDKLKHHLLWATAVYQALPASCHDSLCEVPPEVVYKKTLKNTERGSREPLSTISKRLMESEEIILNP